MTDIRTISNEQLRQLGNQGYSLAMRILRQPEDAADAVQDAMHQMFRKQSSYSTERGSIKSWFLKIVRNRCIDMQRKLRPKTGAETFNPPDVRLATPAEASETDELVQLVRLAMQELNEDAREIILLRDFHGLDYAGIADVLGIAQGTVMSRLHRARQQLRLRVRSAVEGNSSTRGNQED